MNLEKDNRLHLLRLLEIERKKGTINLPSSTRKSSPCKFQTLDPSHTPRYRTISRGEKEIMEMTPNVLKLLTEYLNKAIKEKKAAEQKRTIEEKKPECDQSSKKAEEGMIFEMAKESDSDLDSDPASEKAEEA